MMKPHSAKYIAKEHREADQRCGRNWLKDGCACGACNIARRAIAASGKLREENETMITKTFSQLQQECFDAQTRAEQADRLWQAALDKAGIERYSLQAKYDERVKDFYLARLRAIAAMHEAQDRLRGY